jgi:hypothetical protein
MLSTVIGTGTNTALVGWLFCWLVGWLVGFGWLVGWLAHTAFTSYCFVSLPETENSERKPEPFPNDEIQGGAP